MISHNCPRGRDCLIRQAPVVSGTSLIASFFNNYPSAFYNSPQTKQLRQTGHMPYGKELSEKSSLSHVNKTADTFLGDWSESINDKVRG